jgi:hypothetical protein
LVTSIRNLLIVRLEALEEFSTSRLERFAKPFDILGTGRNQATSIFLPLDKPLAQLVLARRLKLFCALFQTPRASETIQRVRAQLFYLRFALQPSSLQCVRV